jgi:transposase-like protein
MAKYSEELTENIADLIAIELYSVSEVCAALNISRKTFYSWMKTQPYFREEIEKALEQRDDVVFSLAMSSLKKRLSNYTLTEEKDTYVPDENNPEKLIFKSKIIRKKEHLPDLRTIKMVLDRADKKKAAQQNIQIIQQTEEPESVAEQILPVEEPLAERSENEEASYNITEKVKEDKPKKVTSQQIKNRVRVLGNSPSNLPKGRLQGKCYSKVTA